MSENPVENPEGEEGEGESTVMPINNPLPDLTLPTYTTAANAVFVESILIQTNIVNGKPVVGFHVSYRKAVKDADGNLTATGETAKHDDDDIERLAPAFVEMQPQINALIQGMFGMCAAIHQAKGLL